MAGRLDVINTAISAVSALRPREIRDQRGAFIETYNRRDLAALGIALDFVQDNQSISLKRGTIRGLHFQIEPIAQAKLVRVTRGSVLDVAVDLRWGSPTFGQHVSRVLSASNQEQLFVPVGFAHGFCTLEDDTVVVYKVSDFYSPEHERGICWDDPTLAIDWGVERQSIVLSARDQTHPAFAEMPVYFAYRPDGEPDLRVEHDPADAAILRTLRRVPDLAIPAAAPGVATPHAFGTARPASDAMLRLEN